MIVAETVSLQPLSSVTETSYVPWQRLLTKDPKVNPEQVYSDLNYLGTRSEEENRSRVKVINDPYEAISQAHAIAILTEWDEFKNYDWDKIYQAMMKPAFVFDGRALLNQEELKAKGFEVFSIGRS